MTVFHFTEPQHTDDPVYPLRVYTYRADGYHDGGRTVLRSKAELEAYMARGDWQTAREVRITDPGDLMVVHVEGGRVVYPA